MGKRKDRQGSRPNRRRCFAWEAKCRYTPALVACLLTVCSASGQATAAIPQFDQARAWQDLLAQCNIGPRKPGTPEHLKCRDTLVTELKASCDNVHLQEFSHKWTVTGQDLALSNIIGDLNWEKSSLHVVLMAHWDTRALCEQDRNEENRTKPSPGANDGASGVAVLLELARVLKGHLPSDLGIQFVLTDGEDLGPDIGEMLLGSTVYAKSLDKAAKPNYCIVVNMVGKKDLHIPMELNSLSTSKLLIYALSRHADTVGLGETFTLEFGQKISDDHLPLIRAGLHAIDLIDFGYLEFWHTVNDTPEQCSPDSLGQIGKLLQTWFQKDPPFSFPH